MTGCARLRIALAAALLALPGCALSAQDPLARLEAPDALPRPEASWLDLGLRLLDAGRPEQAHDAFIRSLRVEGVTAAALTGAGIAAERQGLVTEARRQFEHALRLAPDSVVAHNNLGAVLYRLGELQSARKAFRTAFALSSGASPQAARNLDITELAIRRAEAENPPLAENPRRVQRLGSAEYRLLAGSATGADSGDG